MRPAHCQWRHTYPASSVSNSSARAASMAASRYSFSFRLICALSLRSVVAFATFESSPPRRNRAVSSFRGFSAGSPPVGRLLPPGLPEPEADADAGRLRLAPTPSPLRPLPSARSADRPRPPVGRPCASWRSPSIAIQCSTVTIDSVLPNKPRGSTLAPSGAAKTPFPLLIQF